MKERTPEQQFWHESLDAAGFKRQSIRLLGKIGLYIAGGIMTAHMAITADDAVEREEARIESFIEGYPAIEEETRFEAAQYELYTKITTGGTVVLFDSEDQRSRFEGEGLTSETELATPEVFKSLVEVDDVTLTRLEESYDEFSKWLQQRNESIDELRSSDWSFDKNKSNIVALLAVGLLARILFPVAKSMHRYGSNNRFLKFKFDEVLDMAEIPKGMHPEWVHDIPAKEVMKTLVKNATLLPPFGAKAVEMKNKKVKNHVIEPAYVAETVVARLDAHREKFGEGFTHHFTVQGKLPDQFKYAGVALVLNNPYATDWKKPFYNAHWGSVGPLIHDGGNTDEKYNKHWRRAKGRTDYIQRIMLNFDEAHQSDPEQVELHMLANQAESMRMMTEARFYQRAALALHAKNGTAPRAIDKQTRKELGAIWDSFQEGTQRLLGAIGIHDFDEIRWFLDEPIDVEWWPDEKRYEADYGQISDVLNRIELARADNEGDIRSIISQAMDTLTADVDKAIGLF